MKIPSLRHHLGGLHGREVFDRSFLQEGHQRIPATRMPVPLDHRTAHFVGRREDLLRLSNELSEKLADKTAGQVRRTMKSLGEPSRPYATAAARLLQQAQEQAFAYGVKISGCTVHFVDEELDHGPIIVQKACPVLESDDEHTLAARILEQEHIAYTEAVNIVLAENFDIVGRRLKKK